MRASISPFTLPVSGLSLGRVPSRFVLLAWSHSMTGSMHSRRLSPRRGGRADIPVAPSVPTSRTVSAYLGQTSARGLSHTVTSQLAGISSVSAPISCRVDSRDCSLTP